MSPIRSVLWLPLRFILLILFSPVVTIVYWFFVLFIGIPSQLFRLLVSFIARQVDSDLGNLVTSKGTLVGRDFAEWETKPSQSITVLLKFKGHGDLHILKQHVLHNWINKENGKNEQLEYPELQQYVTSRLGYLIYKWDRKFDISNHVKIYKPGDDLKEREEVVDDEGINDIWETVATRGYKSKTSPWELLLIQNYDPSGKIETVEELEKLPEDERHCVWILRSHHALTDGFSIYRLILELTDQGLPLWEKGTAREVSKIFNLFFNLKALFIGPTSITNTFLRGFDSLNELHYEINRLTNKYVIVTSTLRVEFLKQAAKLHNISFHAVLIGAISGGVRKYLLQNGLSIPSEPMRVAMPIIKPNHTTKLRNEWISAMVDLPVDKLTVKERALSAQKRWDELKTGALSPFLTQTMTLIGGLPVATARFLTKKSGTTFIYSEFKAPDVQLTMMDKDLRVNEMLFSFGLGTDDLGLGFSSVSYRGKIKLILTLDQAICKTREKAEQLMNCIVSDIEELHFADSTNPQSILDH